MIKKRSITDFSPTIVVSTDLGFGLDKVPSRFFVFFFFF